MRNPLHAICPYFAMFPETFVEKVLNRFTAKGDVVFDPFSGRGTTLLQSLLMGRRAAASDINPVAYVISAAKARPPSTGAAIRRLDELQFMFLADRGPWRRQRTKLPDFFGRGFYYETLEEILFLRATLRWSANPIDCFIAALVLGILHGEMDRSSRYLSNQMPRTISSKPGYSVRYWREHDLWAEKRDTFERLREDTFLRLREKPDLNGKVALADARNCDVAFPRFAGKVNAVITSPPYFNVTRFEEDQWLRLWFLGNPPRPTYRSISKDDRHEQKDGYWKFLTEAWVGLARMVAKGAVLVCRLGGSSMDQTELTRGFMGSLRAAFPDARIIGRPVQSKFERRQTDAFRPNSVGCRFEIDYAVALHG